MTPILLSQFMRDPFLVLTIRGSRGFDKVIRIGTSEYVSKTLTIMLDPNLESEWFTLGYSSSGGIILTQSLTGKVRLTVSPDITLAGSETEPNGDYLKVTFNTSFFKKRIIKTLYYKLDTK